MTDSLLEVDGLTKEYPLRRGRRGQVVRAVQDVSFSLQRGEIFGIVGESGSAKSTTARCIARLIKPTAGMVLLDGEDLGGASAGRLRELRRKLQMIFQDPYSSLNPRMNVGQIVGEGLLVHGLCGGSVERSRRVVELLNHVGLGEEHLRRYPQAFSGGQRQRISIARALAVEPRLLVCDEPVSALDVSVQAQVLNLFKQLREDFELTMLFIAHDLAVVKQLCDRVAVMKDGRIVEAGAMVQIYDQPQHPQTRELLLSSPIPDPAVERRRSRRRRTGSTKSESGT